jgi:hypothetical protein
MIASECFRIYKFRPNTKVNNPTLFPTRASELIFGVQEANRKLAEMQETLSQQEKDQGVYYDLKKEKCPKPPSFIYKPTPGR